MGRIIAITNQKGGVGKTTTAINLSACLAEAGQRVLTVDFDPQGNTTSGLGLEKGNIDNTVYELLMGECTVEECINPSVQERLDVSDVTLTTSPPSIVTTRGQPIGHPIHVNLLSSIAYASSILIVIVFRSGYFKRSAFLSFSSSISPGATTGRFLWITRSSPKYALT